MGSFSRVILQAFALSRNVPKVNTRPIWIRFGPFLSSPARFLRIHWPLTTGHRPLFSRHSLRPPYRPPDQRGRVVRRSPHWLLCHQPPDCHRPNGARSRRATLSIISVCHRTRQFLRMGPKAPVPGVFQALAALAEFGGGLCWVLGLLTPVASLLILGEMAVALGMVHLPQGHPFVASPPGGPSYEPALGYLAIAVALLLVGPGKLSLDAWLFGRGRLGAVEAKKVFAHVPVADPHALAEADAIILGSPTRYGAATAQMQAFLDATGGHWVKGHSSARWAVPSPPPRASTAARRRLSSKCILFSTIRGWSWRVCPTRPRSYSIWTKSRAGRPTGLRPSPCRGARGRRRPMSWPSPVSRGDTSPNWLRNFRHDSPAGSSRRAP